MKEPGSAGLFALGSRVIAVKVAADRGRTDRRRMQLGSRAIVAGKLTQRTWKTEDGSKRTTTEIVASHVAVDLTFAAAEITKKSASDGPSAASSAEDRQSV